MFPNDTDFESEFTFENSATPLSDEPPFHILVLGDWSGDSTKKDLSERRPIVIDRDNFDDVLKKINVVLELDWDDDILTLQFAEIDDFHPDNLYRNISLFSDLRDIRQRLSNPDSFNQTANEVRAWFQTVNPTENDSEISTDLNDAPPIDSNNLLDMILTKPSETEVLRNRQTIDTSELGRFVSKIVSPYLIKIDENEQSNLISAVDETISELMRKILHHPKFQALESAWRGLYFMVKRIETDAELKIFIFDIGKDELINDLKTVNNLTESVLYKRLINENNEGSNQASFAVVGGNYSFNVNVDDVALLMRIGKIMSNAHSPFISYLVPEIFGVKEFSEAVDSSQFKVVEESTEGKLWTTLRSTADANYIGLSPMRILARMPYGENSDGTETFSYEEFTGDFPHNKYLWMNPCFLLILLLARSFRLSGWQMENHFQMEVENLHLTYFQDNGDTKIKPCAEVVLTEKALEVMLEQGVMPLISYINSDKVRLGRFQSISFSKPKLTGEWSF
jgi:type VI secretion system protein ImpC